MTGFDIKEKKRIIVFTDLDDTLLDHVSYSWERAEPALEFCKKLGIPVIPVSSKTRAEIEKIHKAMGLHTPFISENGGGVFFPQVFFEDDPGRGFIKTGSLWKLELGTSYEILARSLKEIGCELNLDLRGFSNMTLKEVSGLTGLSENSALAAMSREFDEPFLLTDIDKEDVTALERAAAKRGLKISQGGRFFHLHGNNDKGEAIKRLLSLYVDKYRIIFSIALGDSPNDFSMFKRVDKPVLVRSEKVFPGLESEFPGIIITNKPGPEGWNSAVLNLVPIILSGGFSDVSK